MSRCIGTGVFALAVLLSAAIAGAQDQAQGIEYDSPRATMRSFLEAINRIELEQGDLDAAWDQALAALDGSHVDAEAARRAARQLNEVLDKLGEVKLNQLPDADYVRRHDQRRYVFFPRAERFDWVYEELAKFDRYPEGEIALEADARGRWRFSERTVGQIGVLAESIRPLPPRYSEPDTEEESDAVVGMLGQTFRNTELWRWGALAGCIFLGLLLGRLAGYALRRAGDRLMDRRWHLRATVFQNLASPVSLALLTTGLMTGLSFLPLTETLETFAGRVVALLFMLALGWLLFNLVDLIDVALRRVTELTENKIDDMIVPLIRKTLRIVLVVVFSLVVAENIFGMDVTGFLAGLGIAGLAVSLAAQDSIKNLFGSLTIFFDKPFLVGDFIIFDSDFGAVEEIGFRSTRIRLLSGHLVTVPNMKFIDNKVENVSLRPYIRREMNITITYDTPPEKIEQAVEILRRVLHDERVVSEGMFDMEERAPKVAFDEFNDASLNIKAYYWYVIPKDSDRGWYSFIEHAQIVNMMLFRRYEEAGIDFAFPTQTLYLAGDPNRQLTVNVAQPEKA